MTGYVLCLPRRCGFNDVLTLFWDSYSYAKKFNRHLYLLKASIIVGATRIPDSQGWLNIYMKDQRFGIH